MESVLTIMNTLGGVVLLFMALLCVFTTALVIDAWSQARADVLVLNAVADYELRRALDKSLDNFCRKCIHLMVVQAFEEEQSRGLR